MESCKFHAQFLQKCEMMATNRGKFTQGGSPQEISNNLTLFMSLSIKYFILSSFSPNIFRVLSKSACLQRLTAKKGEKGHKNKSVLAYKNVVPPLAEDRSRFLIVHQ